MHEASHGAWCHAKTVPMTCRYCGARVFYFSCDCGCSVFFDELGPPWPRHLCLGFVIAQVGSETASQYMATMMATPSYRHFDQRIQRSYSLSVKEQRVIERCEPIDAESLKDVGPMREIVPGIDVAHKLEISSTSAVGLQLLGELAHGTWAQITLHTGDIARSRIQSYTCLIENECLASAGISRGEVVEFCLHGLCIPGRPAIWICDSLRPILG
jgi:hypothetical protein